jgi:hypothetical protein
LVDAKADSAAHTGGKLTLRGGRSVTPRYLIRLRGDFSEASEVFGGIDVQDADGIVELGGRFDQAALHGLLERIRVHGYEVVDIHRQSEPSVADDDAG